MEAEISHCDFFACSRVFKVHPIDRRYRKFNLVEESAFNKTEAAETVVFTTAFGVTFGLVTGHDLLFYSPASELVVEHGVTNFVHPTAWINTMPFLTGERLIEKYGFYLFFRKLRQIVMI